MRADAMRVVRRHVPQSVLVDLQATDNHTNILYIACDWLVIVAAIAVSVAFPSAGVLALAVVVIGSRQRALMNLIHQASHNQLFANRRANYWAGQLLAAFPLLMSIDAYKDSHLAHHRHLWDAEEDPKTIRYMTLGLVTAPAHRAAFLVRHAVRSFGLMHMPFNVRFAVAGDSSKAAKRARLAFWFAVLTVVVALGLEVSFLLYWVLPYCVSFQILRYWMEAAEHAALRSEDPWQATRSWSTSLPIRWFLAPHSDSYHLAHHIVSSVPHYRLGRLHRELMRIPEYAAAHHCEGFVFRRMTERLSVIQDMCRPDCPRAALVVQSALAESG